MGRDLGLILPHSLPCGLMDSNSLEKRVESDRASIRWATFSGLSILIAAQRFYSLVILWKPKIGILYEHTNTHRFHFS